MLDHMAVLKGIVNAKERKELLACFLGDQRDIFSARLWRHVFRKHHHRRWWCGEFQLALPDHANPAGDEHFWHFYRHSICL